MAELRWVLVGIGVAVLVGVYLWSRRRPAAEEEDATEGRVEPRLEHDDEWAEEIPDVLIGEEPQQRSGETGLLFEDLPAADAVRALMERDPKAED